MVVLGLSNVVDTLGAVSSGGSVQACGVVDAEVSTCHDSRD